MKQVNPIPAAISSNLVEMVQTANKNEFLLKIQERIKSKLPVSDKEKALFIKNNPLALAAFMIDNNPGSVNLILRQMGYTHLGFEPNKKALAMQLGIFIDQNNVDDFKEVLRNFKINNASLTQEFLNELNK